MNTYEMIPMTYQEVKVVRALVDGARDALLINGSKATSELDSLAEKFDEAARRLKQKECQKLRELRDGR